MDGLITQALLTGNFEVAVELCLLDDRMADSIILSIAGGADLLEKTQRKYFHKTRGKITKVQMKKEGGGLKNQHFFFFIQNRSINQ